MPFVVSKYIRILYIKVIFMEIQPPMQSHRPSGIDIELTIRYIHWIRRSNS